MQTDFPDSKLERVVLAGIYGGPERIPESSLAELELLTRTAGGETAAVFPQQRDAPDPATYLGKGKVQQIREQMSALGAGTLIIDGELTPVQLRNLEDELRAKVIDRTQLILDIFAQRARTREGRLQVELAQLRYNLPRLVGMGRMLSRLAGGIGTRGPGETRLEADRRRIRERISRLEEEIDRIGVQRGVQRRKRQRAGIPVMSIVGYTNAGKSTLLNLLSGAAVEVEDKLFATLDPTTRRISLPDGRPLLITDTVGFIRDLPHHLVAAFRATLEEVTLSNILLHLADASHPELESQIRTVQEILDELGCRQIPVILVLNKVDKAQPEQLENILRRHPGAVSISARLGQGMEELLEAAAAGLDADRVRVTLRLDPGDGELMAKLYREAIVESKISSDDGILFTAQVRRRDIPLWSANILGKTE